LDGRVGDGAVLAEDATVSLKRFQNLAAAFAAIEPLAGIRRHVFDLDMTAFWTCDFGFKYD
jgi:hypothetical protein